jgi:FkbM family methyltransferase
VGVFGRVFAYEPNPKPHALLAKSLVLNWVHERVVLRPLAVGEFPGKAELMFASSRLGDARIRGQGSNDSTFERSVERLGEVSTIEVECCRLDDEIPVNLPIKLLKIDVEGHEASVLKGASRLLQGLSADYVIIEMIREVAGTQWDETVAAVSELVDRGYTPCSLTRNGSLQPHASLTVALRELRSRTIVLSCV